MLASDADFIRLNKSVLEGQTMGQASEEYYGFDAET